MSELKYLPTDSIVPSASNPRRSTNAAADAELLESVRANGVCVPVSVRPTDGGRFGLIAGFRRWSAATEAGVPEIPAIIHDLDDEATHALALRDNLLREALAPMDEARGFRVLLDFAKGRHTPASVAKAIGKSERHVWDTLKLLDLVPDAQRLLSDGVLPLPHAQLLAKLTPADQKRALDPGGHRGGAVFEGDGGFDFEGTGKPGKWDGLKAVSPAELRRWIQDHVRFDPAHAAKADPLVFTETVQTVAAAQAQPGRGKKVVSITYDSYVQPDAKEGLGNERIFSERNWRRADGQEKSKACDASVLGVVVVGPRYGETFDVCVKKGCPVHWPEDKKAAAKKGGPGTTQHSGNNQDNYRRQEEQRKRQNTAWALVYPKMIAAIVAATAKTATSDKDLVAALDARPDTIATIQNAVGAITYKTFGRAWAIRQAVDDLQDDYYSDYNIGHALKAVKVRFDVKAAMKAALEQLEKPETETPAAGKAGPRAEMVKANKAAAKAKKPAEAKQAKKGRAA